MGEDGAVSALGPAFEIADVDPDADLEAILAGDIFQRGVVLGPMAERAALDGAGARVVVNGEETPVTDPEALPGAIPDLLAHVAALLPAFGEELRPGDIVITGSIVPPLAVGAGDRVEYEASPGSARSRSRSDPLSVVAPGRDAERGGHVITRIAVGCRPARAARPRPA